jgi:hypothetical protein
VLSTRLIRMIENHAEELTRGTLDDIRKNPRTPSYHTLSREALYTRVYEVYRDLGDWLGEKADAKIEAWYRALGQRRCGEGVDLSQVIYALILTKNHLEDYVRTSGLADSSVELYQEQELFRLIEYFFDRALYYATLGYEQEALLRRREPEHASAF